MVKFTVLEFINISSDEILAKSYDNVEPTEPNINQNKYSATVKDCTFFKNFL